MDIQKPFGGVFRGMPVLVTGHTGFKGSWLSIWLNELGAKVIGYSRCSPIKPRNSQLCELDKRLIQVRGDVRDMESVKKAIERYEPQVVIHMAAQAIVRVSYENPKETFDTITGGTINLLEAIRLTKSVKAFVGVTTDKVYENLSWVWGYREIDSLGGHDPYSASKAMAELAIQSYRRSWDTEGFSQRRVAIASARAGNVIGGGDFGEYRIVPDCMRALMKGNPITLRSPEAIRPWQHVLEPLGGYLWLVANLLRQKKNEFSEGWNFGPFEHEAVTCEQITETIIKLWGSGRYEAPDRAKSDGEHRVLKLNWVKAASRLGWKPTYTWEETLAETVSWFKEYHRLASGDSSVDVYDVCVRQIEKYVGRARQLGIEWANP